MHELLRGLMKTGPLAEELHRIQKPAGTAAGRLVLGENLKALQVRGEITRVELAARYQAIPFPLKISGGPVAWDATAVTLQILDVTAAGSAGTRLAGTVGWGKAGQIDLKAGPCVVALGEIHPWLASLEPLRRQLNAIQSFEGKLELASVTLKGPVADPRQWAFNVSGKLTQQAGPEISATVTRSPGEVKIDPLVIRDEASRATLTAVWAGGALDVTFSGNLHANTLNRLWAKNDYLTGELSGDFKARIPLGSLLETTMTGRLQAVGLRLPLERPAGPITVERLALNAQGQKVVIAPENLFTWGRSRIDVSGSVASAGGWLRLDLDVAADVIDGTAIERAVETKAVKAGSQPGKGSQQRLPMAGTVRFKAREVTYDPYTVKPLAADITFDGDYVEVKISQADLCGISLPGWVKITPGEIAFDFKPAAQNREIDPTIDCLGRKGSDLVGRFDLNGHVYAQGPADKLADNLRGELEFTAPAGRVRRSLELEKMLRILNTTEVLVGKLPDLNAEGFTYEGAHIKCGIEGSRLTVQEYLVDGSSMKITGQGTVDLRTRQMDATALVAPLKTVDRLVSKLPLIGYILGDSLVSIPIKISGDWENPQIAPLDPKLVGTGLLEMTERTLKLPFEILKPIPPPAKRPSQSPSP